MDALGRLGARWLRPGDRLNLDGREVVVSFASRLDDLVAVDVFDPETVHVDQFGMETADEWTVLFDEQRQLEVA